MPLRGDNAVFTQESSCLIDQPCSLCDMAFANTVQTLDILLLKGFHRNGSNIRPTGGFTDGNGITIITLIASNERRDMLSGNQFGGRTIKGDNKRTSINLFLASKPQKVPQINQHQHKPPFLSFFGKSSASAPAS